MPDISNEKEVLMLFFPHIEEYCKCRWMNIEPEDRISEACVQFCNAFRQFPLGSGHFWHDYIKFLTPYMDDLNRRTPSLRFERNLSLDRPYCGFNSQNTVTLLDYLPDRTTDETALYVDAFKKSLSQQSREIIDALEQGIARTVVARDLPPEKWPSLNEKSSGSKLPTT